MTCDKEAVVLMHKYLDGDLTSREESILRRHLQSCQDCQHHFHELKRTVTLLKNSGEMQVPADFTTQVMNNLPREKKRAGFVRWMRNHPLVTAAAIFFLFMFSGIFSAWNQDSQLSVSKQQNLLVQEDIVIVPEDVTVEGDLVVRNGDLRIEGKVDGNVTIINGEHLLASAGEVSGELEQVNQVFDWIWYTIKDMFKSIFSLGSNLHFNEKNEKPSSKSVK